MPPTTLNSEEPLLRRQAAEGVVFVCSEEVGEGRVGAESCVVG